MNNLQAKYDAMRDAIEDPYALLSERDALQALVNDLQARVTEVVELIGAMRNDPGRRLPLYQWADRARLDAAAEGE